MSRTKLFWDIELKAGPLSVSVSLLLTYEKHPQAKLLGFEGISAHGVTMCCSHLISLIQVLKHFDSEDGVDSV